jgi:hypothetical protein
MSTTDLAGDLERALEKVLEELQVMFPAPNKAPGHDDRQKAVSSALEKAGAELKAVCGKHGMDEENVAAHWETIQGAIENMVVLLGGCFARLFEHPSFFCKATLWNSTPTCLTFCFLRGL